MTLPPSILEAVDRFGDLCTENPQTGVKLVERDRLLAVIEQHMPSTLSPKAEWSTLDPRWLVKYLREHTKFDAEAVSEMIVFAQAAAATQQGAASLAYQGSDDE